MKKNNFSVSSTDIAQCSIFVCLMMITGVVIKIPFPLVPLTFQTVVCVLSGLMLGWKKGAAAMFAYMVLGLIGVPVFAAGGGIAYVVKPSFGYVVGFVAAAAVTGIIRGKNEKAGLARCIFAAAAGFVVNYVVGIVYFIAVWLLSGFSGLGAAIVSYNLVYMPKDIVLCVLAAFLYQRLAPVIAKKNSERKKTADPEESGTAPKSEKDSRAA